MIFFKGKQLLLFHSWEDGLNKRVIYKALDSDDVYREISKSVLKLKIEEETEQMMTKVLLSIELEAIIIKIWKLAFNTNRPNFMLNQIHKQQFIYFCSCVKLWLFLLDDSYLDRWSEEVETQWYNRSIYNANNVENISNTQMHNAMLSTRSLLGFWEFKNYWLFMFYVDVINLSVNKVNSYLRAIFKLMIDDQGVRLKAPIKNQKRLSSRSKSYSK